MDKKNKKIRWDWKNIFIGLLIFLLVCSIYSNIQFREQVKDSVHEYELNVTRTIADFETTHDCFDRGAVECYEKGTVNCYGK